MNIMEEIKTQLAIYCDDHLDVEREGNICTVEMWDCEYSCDPLTDDIKLILDDIKEFDIKISSIYIEQYADHYDVTIKGIMTPWLAYQDEILTKHERYIRKKRGLPLGPRPNKKNYCRVVKCGFTQKTRKQQYVLIDENGQKVKQSVDKDKLEQLMHILIRESMQKDFPFLFRGL